MIAENQDLLSVDQMTDWCAKGRNLLYVQLLDAQGDEEFDLNKQRQQQINKQSNIFDDLLEKSHEDNIQRFTALSEKLNQLREEVVVKESTADQQAEEVQEEKQQQGAPEQADAL